MSKMRAAQVARPNGPLEIVEREIPEPGAGSVRIKVEACGICHSDAMTKEGTWPGIEYPRVPGHEVAGIIDAVGTGVVGWTAGQRDGVGWHGGEHMMSGKVRFRAVLTTGHELRDSIKLRMVHRL
jgi:D-arabinose 1-dehydrogenase-like Zn-dependent alcohol dehydrogenase